MLGGGDQLARGARKANFSTADITEAQWKEIFGQDAKKPNILSDEEAAILDAAEAELRKRVNEENAANPQAEVKFRAVQDRIVVRRVEAETKIGTLFVADESKEKPYEGIVVAVGPGRYVEGQLQPVSVKVGERVVFGKFSGAEVKIGFETLLVLREEDVFIVKE